MSAEELRTLRLKRGWTLADVAVAVGVTPATLSRWERGLQTPPEHAKRLWEKALTGTSPPPVRETRRRRPRGVLPRLAELFLADVKAGENGWNAGWRELREVGLTCDDLAALESDIEVDGTGRVRIHFRSRLEAVQEAQNILGYKRTVAEEERRLIPALSKYLPRLTSALDSEHMRSALLFAGFTEMIHASAAIVETSRSFFDNDPQCLVNAPSGGAKCLLGGVGITIESDVVRILRGLGFANRIPGTEAHDQMVGAEAVAGKLGLDVIARRLEIDVVTALGAAWAISRWLTDDQVGITTDTGVRRFSAAFWDGVGLTRNEVDVVWRNVMIEEFQPESETQQLGLLMWSWPEFL